MLNLLLAVVVLINTELNFNLSAYNGLFNIYRLTATFGAPCLVEDIVIDDTTVNNKALTVIYPSVNFILSKNHMSDTASFPRSYSGGAEGCRRLYFQKLGELLVVVATVDNYSSRQPSKIHCRRLSAVSPYIHHRNRPLITGRIASKVEFNTSLMEIGAHLCFTNAPGFKKGVPNQYYREHADKRCNDAECSHRPLRKRILSVKPSIKWADPKMGIVLIATLVCALVIPAIVVAYALRRITEPRKRPNKKY